jgi:ceramide glucosyltransferase
MDLFALAAATFALAATLLHILTVLIAAARFNRPSSTAGPAADLPPVTIIRPLCGVDAYEDETLQSVFRLDHPGYEIILCVADPGDPVIPLARAAMAAHPHVSARLLIGDDRISPNPKLNNVVKGWRAARHDWIVIVDSNVLVPRDYLGQLLATWRTDTGLVCSPPIGALPRGFAAEIECAFLNTYQARWQYAVDSLGHGFAQGKTMLWRRDDLDAVGGGGCRSDQGGARPRPTRPSRRSPISPASRRTHLRQRLASPASLGASAPGVIPRLLRAGDPDRPDAAYRCGD